MRLPSLTVLGTGIFLIYVVNAIIGLAQLFITPTCKPNEKCIQYYLSSKPALQMVLFTTVRDTPTTESDVKLVATIPNFNYSETFEKTVLINLPRATRNNGTLYLHAFVLPNRARVASWSDASSSKDVVYTRAPLTHYQVPLSTAFQLLKGDKNKGPNRPVTHVKAEIGFNILTNVEEFPRTAIPAELYKLMQLSENRVLPLLHFDFLNDRLDHLREISNNKTAEVILKYSPISLGKLRFVLQTEVSFRSMKEFGLSDKDLDQVKGIFADINIVLLCVTLFISSIHLLFDFLALKNDVIFWRSRKSMVGLSLRAVLWRAFSQIVILLYLFDEDASLLVVVPTAIGTVIELWKVQKVLPIDWRRLRFKPVHLNEEELRTRSIDAEGMKYLTYLLYPLCFCGAIYSLLYLSHKSWYSWVIHSLVNGVYAFGFLFMLPQLFINYKLKSVAHLPWRAFMYKAFNTFIDDLFAFIISMPTAHRLACFRDDVVFVIYMYQRWLYPVDKTRIDDSVNETVGEESPRSGIKED